VCGAHKWLMGIEGAGFLYASERAARALERRTPGWLSHEDALRFLLDGPGELRYDRVLKSELQYLEGSSLSNVSYGALDAAVEALVVLGTERIFEHVSRYLDALELGFRARGVTLLRAPEPERRSGILSVIPPAGLKAADIARELRLHGVFVSMPDGLVRFAPHYPNPEAEVSNVLSAWDEALLRLRNF
jgi:selenocysteine lyase/cysteine desulfurase